MKYVVEMRPELAERIQTLVSKRKYDSVSQFAVAAIENQLLLEEGSEEQLGRLIAQGRDIETVTTSEDKKVDIKSLLSLNFDPKRVKVVPPPDPGRTPTDCLWGQYNRIFPVKIVVRVLANLLKDEEAIGLTVFQPYAILAAREIGSILKKKDREHKRKYGELLSSALPTSRDSKKTDKRFLSHFVGYLTRAGRIEGAPAALKFVNVFDDSEGNQKIGLTQAGLTFALLDNPVLDKNDFERTLDKKESDFYIKHVFNNLEREGEVTSTILKAIAKGESNPSKLSTALGSFSRGWSAEMTNTIRAGVISRSHELGLVDRIRQGVRVSYTLTEYGQEILKTLPTTE